CPWRRLLPSRLLLPILPSLPFFEGGGSFLLVAKSDHDCVELHFVGGLEPLETEFLGVLPAELDCGRQCGVTDLRLHRLVIAGTIKVDLRITEKWLDQLEILLFPKSCD